MVLVLYETEPFGEKTDTLDVVVNKGSLMGGLVRGSLMSSSVKR